jgi:heme exporter protein C
MQNETRTQMKPAFVAIALITFALLTYGLQQAMVGAPTEQTMGEVQRIFYYHVPSAWVAFLCFFVNFLASIWYLVKRSARTDAVALACAEVGVVFCTIVLITGPLWARPVWGIWWTWDARLTSTLVLWLIYVSYLILRRYGAGGQTPVIAAALAIFGFVDVPLVYMSIRWFRTQHPQPVIGGGQGSGIHPAMLHALLMNFLAFSVFAIVLIWLRYRLEVMEQTVESAYASRALSSNARSAR